MAAVQTFPDNVHNADDIDCARFTIGAPYKGKKHQNKLSAIKPKGDPDARVEVVFDNLGRLPKFALDITDKGAMYLSFSVRDEATQKSMWAADVKVLDRLGENEMWPERKKAPDRDTLEGEGGYNPILKQAKEKNGVTYAPICKVGVPTSGGEAAKSVKIVDAKGRPVSINDIAGRKVARLVISFNYIYYKGLECGVVKKLVYLRLAPERDDAAVVKMYDDIPQAGEGGDNDWEPEEEGPGPSPPGGPKSNAPEKNEIELGEQELLELLGDDPVPQVGAEKRNAEEAGEVEQGSKKKHKKK